MTAPREFTWNGVTRYGCPICRWDTGDRESMAEHLAVVHQVAISAPAEVIRRKHAKASVSVAPDTTDTNDWANVKSFMLNDDGESLEIKE